MQDSVIEKSEDQQLAAAIAASLQEKSTWSQSRDDSSEERDDDDVESLEYSDEESCTVKDKQLRNDDKGFLTSEINQCANRIKENSLDKNNVESIRQKVFEEGDEDESKFTGTFEIS